MFFVNYSEFIKPNIKSEENKTDFKKKRQELQSLFKTCGSGVFTIFHKRHCMLPQQGVGKAIIFDQEDEEVLSPSKREMNKLWMIVRKVQSY